MKNNEMVSNFLYMVRKNIVVIVFTLVCVLGYFISGMSLPYVIDQVMLRIAENSFLVLALIIPVIAGMGLNFSMTIGAMAAQIGVFFVTYWAYSSPIFEGLPGFLIAALLTTPISVLFGLLAGLVLNKTKGQEMITGMILGFFATGIYMLLLLFMVGQIIPIDNPTLILSNGVGVKNTFDLSDRGVLNNLFNRPMQYAGMLLFGSSTMYMSARICTEKKKIKPIIAYAPFIIGTVMLFIYAFDNNKTIFPSGLIYVCKYAGLAVVGISVAFAVYSIIKGSMVKIPKLVSIAVLGILLILVTALPYMVTAENQKLVMGLLNINVPMSTYAVIGLLCMFNNMIQKTKLGQDIRTVGQSMSVATASGINVNKIRLIAIIISTVFAGWGQLIYLQSIGTVQTYAAHQNVALYSIAALLVGGASISKATNKQAIIGIVLFHTMLIILPDATKAILNDAQHSEYFRAFMLYSVICISLITHAMEVKKKRTAKE